MVASIKPHRDEAGLSDGSLLIDGQWCPARSGQTWSHRHPATGEEVASFPVAGPDDVDLAVRAARRAFDEGPWPRLRAGERIRLLRRIADLVREHGDELLVLQALDNSVPLSFGSVYATSSAFVADVFDHHAGWVDKLAGETLAPFQGGDHMVMTLREPVGVVGAVVPWNAPILLAAQKIAPALAAGCTIVLKPSEYATFAVLPRPVRAGLPGADPGAGAPGCGRRVPRHGRDDRHHGQLGQPVRPRRHRGAADQHPAAGPGARADRRGPGRWRPAGLRRHPQPGRPGGGQLRHADPVH
jgi:aldehyde dehydrogenase (NAD+)